MISLQNLLEAARCEHIFPKLKSVSLLSVIQIFDQASIINFSADQFSVTLDKQTILAGPCEKTQVYG